MHRALLIVLASALALIASPAYALKSDAQKPINIRARQVDANEKTGVAVYRGNVVLTQGSLRLEADRLEVTLREGRTDLIRAWGDPVRLRTRTDEGEELRARAHRLTYRAGTRQIELRESVELLRDSDLLTGAKIDYQLDNQTFRAEGNGDGQVSVVIQPAKPQATP